MKKESRTMTRRHIFNIIYQYTFNKNSTIEDCIQNYKEIIEYEYNYETEYDKNFERFEMDDNFINSEVGGIVKNFTQLDEIIEKYIVGWKIERLASVDLTILRLAVYEILFDETIPAGVSANEAVELAKDYSSEKSPSFINGVLSSIIKNEKERV